LGFIKAMQAQGITVETTAVGDRYVLEKMLADDLLLGGEQSGHIIMRNFSHTGDGVLTALQLMQCMAISGKSLSDLAKVMTKFPQVLINVKEVNKSGLDTSAEIAAEISASQESLADRGRILVRASGTENLVRVMVEADSHDESLQIAQRLAEIVRSELG